jgi:hypothetical protein
MFDTHSLTILAVVVFATVVIYVVERYTKSKPIDSLDAVKLGVLSAGLTGGVIYTLGEGNVGDIVSSAVEDMFVGKPSF